MAKGKKKILIVEDDLSYSNVFSDVFSDEGMHVLSAKNGQEGLDIALKEHPDLLVVDIAMPVMDGLTMIKKLRENEWGKDADVILLTNLFDMDKVAEAAEKGAFDYLVKKDWSMEDLVKKVKKRLNL